MSAHLLVVGPFPPPRHGVSAVNEAMHSAANKADIVAQKYDTAPASLDRSLRVRLRRLEKISGAIRSIRAFGREHPQGTVYFSLSGGFGLIYEAVLIGVAQAARLRVMVHHHSFRYLDRTYWPMRLLVRLAGQGALHVVLGRGMGEKLQQRYPRVGRVEVMNNAVFVGPPLSGHESGPNDTPFTVGFIANLSPAKGLDDVLELAELAQRAKSDLRFKIAGPFEDPADESRYRRRFSDLPNLEYVGPVYGEAKEAFWRSLTVFAFPTRYRNEAEPLVVHEALRHGKPVIALGRGCIAGQVGDAGLVLPPDGDFSPEAWRILTEWKDKPGGLPEDRARARYAALHEESSIALKQILQLITHHSAPS